jgi:hypothetical protein
MTRLLSLSLLLLLLVPAAEAAATPQYPDLRTLPPRDLRFDRTDVNGSMNNVLRFSNTVTNEGQGKLLLRGTFGSNTNSAPAVQHVFDETGATVAQYPVSTYTYHDAHQHYHFDDWGRYELWTKGAYDAWIAAGRPATTGPDVSGSKTTSCVMDEEFVKTLPSTPWPDVFPASGCQLNKDNVMTQGLSVGWGDTYDYYRQEQWIDLKQGSLADGDYVLRSVTDPLNRIHESTDKADPTREGVAANEAVTPFRVSGSVLVDGARPSGSVWVNGVDAATSSSSVTVRVVGRDDVSGVDQVRVSNDGVNWATYTYGGAGSTPMLISWDLADARYGGTTTGGTRTVYAQFRDASGKWSPTEIDTITYSGGTGGGGGGTSTAYTEAIMADDPVSWWRLGERTGVAAADQRGLNPGTFRGAPTLGAASLLKSDANTAVTFNGTNSMTADTETGLAAGPAFSLEAWIRPASLPAAGQFRSIATRAEAYSLQFNGPLLEWTVVQGGARRRLQAPSGTVQPGGTYHVVGSFDGATQRLYVNGIQVASVGLTGTVGAGYGFSIGAWDGSSEYFNGTIDEVAFYSKVLPGLQVKKHHDVGIATVAGVPAPTGLSATSVSTSRIDLAWTDNASNETGYTVERATNSAFTGATAISLPAGAVSYSDVGLTSGTTYWYRVRAATADETSAWSAAASAATATATPSPTPTPTATSTPAPSPTPTVTAVPSPSPSPSPSPTPTPTVTAVPSPTPTPTSTPAPSPTPTVTAAPSPTPTPTSTPAPSTYSTSVLADGPVSYWRLEETSGTTATDVRGLNPGTYLNTPTLGVAGLMAQPGARAVRFDGVNESVRVANSASLQLGAALTLEAWVRPAFLPASGSFASIVSKPEAYSLQFNGPRLEFTIMQRGTRYRLQLPAGTVQVGGTYHVVGTYDGATQRLYLNGTLRASRAQTGPPSAVSHPLHIGAWNTGGEFLGGVVDEVAVYGKTLSAARVTAHYQASGGPATTTARVSRTRARRKTKLVQDKTRRAALRKFRRSRRTGATARASAHSEGPSMKPLCRLEQQDKERLERTPPEWRSS